MKKLISSMIVLSMIVSLFAMCGATAFAEENNILDYITYEINDGEVTITDCDDSISGDVVIPDTIEGYPVVNIKSGVFALCTNIINVRISRYIKNISNEVFRGYGESLDNRYRLKSFIVDENNENYSVDENGVLFNKDKTELICYPADCSVSEYIIPDNVNRIATFAFAYCHSLKSITIPSGVTSIGWCSFINTDNLTKIICNANNVFVNDDMYIFEDIGSETADVELIVGENFEKIPNYYFRGANITDVVIPESVTEIGRSAFSGCRRLQNVEIPTSVTKIYAGAFDNCSGIKNITIPNSVVACGAAFYNCENLENLIIGNSLEKIADKTFSNCIKLKNVVIGNSVKSIGTEAFYNCKSLESISIPDSVEYISKNAFVDSGLKSIIVNNKKCVIEYDAATIPADAVIYGHKNSPAQMYAYMYARDFVALSEDSCAHSYSEWVVDADANCTQRGFAHRVCANCNGYEFNIIESIGHVDADDDKICDNCEETLSVYIPDYDVDEDTDTDTEDSSVSGLTALLNSIKAVFERIAEMFRAIFGGK